MEGMIKLTDKFYVRNCENASSYFDLYEKRKTKKNPDGVYLDMAWGIPLEKAIQKVIYKVASEDSDTVMELLDKAKRLRDDIYNNIKELKIK